MEWVVLYLVVGFAWGFWMINPKTIGDFFSLIFTTLLWPMVFYLWAVAVIGSAEFWHYKVRK